MYADNIENVDEEEIFIASCDLTVEPEKEHVMHYIRKITEECSNLESKINIPLWKKCLCCKECKESFHDKLWMLAVRCAPNKCFSNKCCILLDCVSYFLKCHG